MEESCQYIDKIVTLGIAQTFQKEFDAYNVEHKTLKTQAKVQENDKVRINEQQQKSTKAYIASLT